VNALAIGRRVDLGTTFQHIRVYEAQISRQIYVGLVTQNGKQLSY
jgi:hypothetical protein